MTEDATEDVRLNNALSTETRTAHRYLLVSSAIGIAIAKMGVVPEKISALGIDFSKISQKSFLYIVAAVSSYFLVAFLIYGLSDYLRLKNRIAQTRLAFAISQITAGASKRGYCLSGLVSLVRTIFEFVVPVAIGAYSISSLVSLAATI